MTTTALKIRKINRKELERQVSRSPTVNGKLKEIVLAYLISANIQSLEDITIDDVYNFREYISRLQGINDRQRKCYASLLEQVVLAYDVEQRDAWQSPIDKLTCAQSIKNKMITFLILLNVQAPNEINYEIRCEYETFLEKSDIYCKKNEYMKALDNLKLNAIKAENASKPFKEWNLKFEKQKIFLLYHPNYQLAKTFYYVQNKEELVFDFSIRASGLLKRQILKMLNHVLQTKENLKDRRERFLIPLNLLYAFCVSKNIEDIEQLTEKQIYEFRKSIEGGAGSKTDIYTQIIDNIRKYLFLGAKDTNWNANVWYLERFNFVDGRENLARKIRRFSFNEIENVKNRNFFKEYMKYELGVSQKSSLLTLRGTYYEICTFLKYLDQVQIEVTKITAIELEAFIKREDEKNNQPEAFNKSIIAVAKFFGFLQVKKYIEKVPLNFSYHLKKVSAKHNDRAVDIDTQIEILKLLQYFPNHLRLMYLNLWCIGLRVSEVCIIKANSYIWDGKDAWLKIHQSKMKAEKYVPIPTQLYKLMRDYIEFNGITSEEYVFKSKQGGAYDAGTFCKQFKKQLEKLGMKEYKFKAHDFRHTVATFLYRNGSSIEAIRDYLGHKSTDMTKQYLDYMQDVLNKENEKYFRNGGNELAKMVLKGGQINAKKDIS